MIRRLQTWLEDTLFAPANGAGRRPELYRDLESSVPGLFTVGRLAGAPDIKLAMEQGWQVAEHIASLPRPRLNAGVLDIASNDKCISCNEC